MFDFVPIQYYNYIYYNVILIFIIVTWIHTRVYTGLTQETFDFNNLYGFILFLFIVLYMGLRPVSWYFGDMRNYSRSFDMFANGQLITGKGDIVFYSFMRLLANFDAKRMFFFLISFFYVFSLYLSTKRLFKNYHYFAFLILVCSFEFWSYGVNGIRSGLAASLILLAFTYINKKWFMYILFFIAVNIHSSVTIPIMAYIVSVVYKSESLYFKIWIVSIFLSLFIGGIIENFITSLGFMSERTVDLYFNRKDQFSSSFAMEGFRWDFLLYSFIGVVNSYYFIHVKKINDAYYTQLTNIYLLGNSVWILVINASFSNRFAYLSWFMMGIIIIYPFFKKVYWKNQFSIIGTIILLYFSFTYLMNFILPNI